MGYHFWEIDRWYEGVMGKQLTPHTTDLQVQVEGCCCTVYFRQQKLLPIMSLFTQVYV